MGETLENKSGILSYKENKIKNINNLIKTLKDKLKQLENNLTLLNPIKKEVLLNQIKQLKEIKKAYEKQRIIGITERTNLELNNILTDIEQKLDTELVGYDIKKTIQLLKEENQKKKDTYDLYGKLDFPFHRITYRDFIEKHINFIGIKESSIDGETIGINNFLNYLTIEYINFLDQNPIIKATHKNLSKLKQLNIRIEDFMVIIEETIKIITKKGIILNFNKIEVNIGGKKLKLDLNQIRESVIIKIKKEEFNKIKNIIDSTKNIEELKNIIKTLKGDIPNNKNALLIFLKIEKLESLGINLDKNKIIKLIENKLNEVISFLLEKYIKIKDIKNRGDINNYNFIKRMMFDYYEGKISVKDFKEILIKGYYHSFKKETKSIKGKEGLKNLKVYEKKWKGIFLKEIGAELSNPKNAEDLFLLAWVESNCSPDKESPLQAQGRFQILLSTANKIDNNKYTIEDLHNPITSAIISAKYLKQIIIQIKKENPNKDFTDKQLLEIAITRYNGNWSTRLKDSFKQKNNNDSIKIIYLVFKELNFIKAKINEWDLDKIKTKLIETHNKFFKKHPNRDNGETHFGILDDINKGIDVTKKDIIDWIDKYTSEILKQQLMYPYQLEAMKELYYEL